MAEPDVATDPEFDIASAQWRDLTGDALFRCLVGDDPRGGADPGVGRGRFGAGDRTILYTASSARGAAAEYYRRHPELLAVQEGVRLRIYELSLIADNVLDVVSEENAAAVGIDHQRLVSSEVDEESRYRECRALASFADAAGASGIAHENAALQNGSTWNAALFGQPQERWRANVLGEVDRPLIGRDEIHALPT